MGGLRLPPNPPGLGLYPSIPEPRRRVVAVRDTSNADFCSYISKNMDKIEKSPRMKC